jgi:hypothetical protein
MKTFRQVRPLETHANAYAAGTGMGTSPGRGSVSGADGAAEEPRAISPQSSLDEPGAGPERDGGLQLTRGDSSSSSSSSHEGGGGSEGASSLPPALPGLVCFPLGGSGGKSGASGSRAGAIKGQRRPEVIEAGGAPPLPLPLAKEVSGSSEGSTASSGEGRSSSEAKAEAIFDLAAKQRKRKLGQALVVDPTTTHLEQTLREMVVEGGGSVADLVVAPGGAGPALSGGGSSSSSSSSGSQGGQSSGGVAVVAAAAAAVAGPGAVAAGGGGGKKKNDRRLSSSSLSPPPASSTVPPHQQQKAERAPMAVDSGPALELALGAREDEAMLLLSLRNG